MRLFACGGAFTAAREKASRDRSFGTLQQTQVTASTLVEIPRYGQRFGYEIPTLAQLDQSTCTYLLLVLALQPPVGNVLRTLRGGGLVNHQSSR